MFYALGTPLASMSPELSNKQNNSKELCRHPPGKVYKAAIFWQEEAAPFWVSTGVCASHASERQPGILEQTFPHVPAWV